MKTPVMSSKFGARSAIPDDEHRRRAGEQQDEERHDKERLEGPVRPPP